MSRPRREESAKERGRSWLEVCRGGLAGFKSFRISSDFLLPELPGVDRTQKLADAMSSICLDSLTGSPEGKAVTVAEVFIDAATTIPSNGELGVTLFVRFSGRTQHPGRSPLHRPDPHHPHQPRRPPGRGHPAVSSDPAGGQGPSVAERPRDLCDRRLPQPLPPRTINVL